MPGIEIRIADEQEDLALDHDRLRQAISLILADAGVTSGEISIAIVDDPTIHDLNRRFLEHDSPTDVLSFPLARESDRLDGEVVVSADTARRQAAGFGWKPEDELLLYVIHGTLHLVGYDDLDPAAQVEMRKCEQHYLAKFGLKPRYASRE